MTLHHKLEKLERALSEFGRVAVFFSGGVDSTFLLKTAVNLLGEKNVLALLADTPSMPRSEVSPACALAKSTGCTFKVVKTSEIDDPVYISNPVDRCYFCKKIIFGRLIEVAGEYGFETVLDGNNSDDAEDYRPGHQAAVELGVLSPLMDAGLGKQDIRDLSRALGLPTADKPALACLATRVPAGRPISRELLMKIERAEQVLWDAGFSQIRVRDYEDTAHLEIAGKDFAAFGDEVLREKVLNGIKSAGYAHVLVDLQALSRR